MSARQTLQNNSGSLRSEIAILAMESQRIAASPVNANHSENFIFNCADVQV
jgi:hypothetical protein